MQTTFHEQGMVLSGKSDLNYALILGTESRRLFCQRPLLRKVRTSLHCILSADSCKRCSLFEDVVSSGRCKEWGWLSLVVGQNIGIWLGMLGCGQVNPTMHGLLCLMFHGSLAVSDHFSSMCFQLLESSTL
jgi:hypothetical protein